MTIQIIRNCRWLSAAWILALMIASSAALEAQEPLKVTEEAAREAAVSKELPEYPVIARRMKVSGKATIEIVIDADGKPEKCEPVLGNPMLTGAAVNAVKKWKFKPFEADGKPSRAVARLTFNFSL